MAAAALGAGESGKAVAALLHQGPYARFQQDLQGVAPPTIEHYARGTVAQVQAFRHSRSGNRKGAYRALEG